MSRKKMAFRLVRLSASRENPLIVDLRGTTIMATLALFILGGGVIHSFALTMLVGVIVGTYSSIYVASPILLALGSTEFYVRAAQKEEYEKPGEHGIV